MTRTSASVGSIRPGSGTVSTRTSPAPYITVARTTSSYTGQRSLRTPRLGVSGGARESLCPQLCARLSPPDDLVRVEGNPDGGDERERDERQDHHARQGSAARRPCAATSRRLRASAPRGSAAPRTRTGRGPSPPQRRSPRSCRARRPTCSSAIFIANAKSTMPATIGRWR